MKPELIEIKARLTLYPESQGGRKSGIISGYRPNHVFEYHPHSGEFTGTYAGKIEFAQEEMRPGETLEVTVHFLNLGDIENRLKPGIKWWIHEGPRKVGEAEILNI